MTGQKKTARRRVEKGTPLYEWRMNLGITQEDAAKEFGISFSLYRTLENQHVLPKRYDLAFATVRGKSQK